MLILLLTSTIAILYQLASRRIRMHSLLAIQWNAIRPTKSLWALRHAALELRSPQDAGMQLDVSG